MRGHSAQRGNPTHTKGPEYGASSLRAAGPSSINADFRHFYKGGDYFHCQSVGLRRTDSLKGKTGVACDQAFSGPTGLVSRDRFTGSLSVSPDGYGPRVVGNTYQKG